MREYIKLERELTLRIPRYDPSHPPCGLDVLILQGKNKTVRSDEPEQPRRAAPVPPDF
jgi:hypothetical protein